MRRASSSAEPRAASPVRLETIRQLAAAKIPTAVMVAPVIPALNDAEIEAILVRAHAMGASEAGYILLRLPLEVRDLFTEWLQAHCPEKLKHVLALMRSTRGGKLYDSRFGMRMSGSGPYAWMLWRRFQAAAARLGLGEIAHRFAAIFFGRPDALANNCGCSDKAPKVAF
jgi:DNA repair photolyase